MSFEEDFDAALAGAGFPAKPLDGFHVTDEHLNEFDGDSEAKERAIKRLARKTARARLGDLQNFNLLFDSLNHKLSCSAGFNDVDVRPPPAQGELL